MNGRLQKLIVGNRNRQRSPFKDRLRASLFAGALASVVTACSDAPSAAYPPLPPSIAAFVTAEVAASVDNDGRIAPTNPLELPFAQITAERARALAESYRRIFIRSRIENFEKDRGRAIKEPELRICGRTYYTEPVIQSLPASVPISIHKAYGPHWLVTYCGSSGAPEVSVAVAAHATDIGLQNGLLVYPRESGGEFVALGVPVGRQDGVPGSPESAIAHVARLTGARVNALPHLVHLPRIAPQLGLWKLELERPVMLRSLYTRKTINTSVVYFIDDPRWGHRGVWVAAESAPQSFGYGWGISSKRYGERPTFIRDTVSVRPGFSLRLEPVEEPPSKSFN